MSRGTIIIIGGGAKTASTNVSRTTTNDEKSA